MAGDFISWIASGFLGVVKVSPSLYGEGYPPFDEAWRGRWPWKGKVLAVSGWWD